MVFFYQLGMKMIVEKFRKMFELSVSAFNGTVMPFNYSNKLKLHKCDEVKYERWFFSFISNPHYKQCKITISLIKNKVIQLD